MIAGPLLQRRARTRLTSQQWWALQAMMLVALLAADVDFALKLLPDAPLNDHGTVVHSLLAAVVAGLLFAAVGRWLVRLPMSLWTLAMAGGLAYASHLAMDAMTRGRGIMLLWPFTEQRYSTPVWIFFGAEHSQLLAWRLHLITLSTELVFALLVWLVARWWLLGRDGRGPVRSGMGRTQT